MLIPPNKKRERDECLENKEIKVGANSSKDNFLILMSNWPTFSLPGIGNSIYRKDHIRKSGEYNLGLRIADRDERADNLGPATSTADWDKKTDNPGISKVDADIGVDNLGRDTNIDVDRGSDNPSRGMDIRNVDIRANKLDIDISKANKGVNNPGTNTNKVDGGADNLSINIGKVNRKMNNPGIGIGKVDGRINNLDTYIGKTDRKVDNLGKNTSKADRRADNLGVKITNADIANNLGKNANRGTDK